MNYKLRAAQISEKDLIFEAYRTTVGPYVAEAWGWEETSQREGFWRHHPLDEFMVIESSGKFAGGLHTQVENQNDRFYIRMIFLLPEFQNRGIGTQLIQDTYSALPRGKGLHLTVIKDNPAIRLYQRLGFRIIGEENACYEMRKD